MPLYAHEMDKHPKNRFKHVIAFGTCRNGDIFSEFIGK